MNFYAPDYDAWRGSNSYVYELEREHFVAWALGALRDDGRKIEVWNEFDAEERRQLEAEPGVTFLRKFGEGERSILVFRLR